MAVDLDKLMLHSSYNSYKNNAVARGNLVLPTTLAAATAYTNSLTFTLSQAAAFMQVYSYATDYGDYFNYLDSQYHDAWRVVNLNYDYFIRGTNAFGTGIFPFNIRVNLSGTTVTVTLYAKNNGSSTVTYIHPTGIVPISVIDYTLAN